MRIISDPESQRRLNLLTERVQEVANDAATPADVRRALLGSLNQANQARTMPVPYPKSMVLLDRAPEANATVVGLPDGRICSMQLLRGEWSDDDFGGHRVLTDDELTRAKVIRIKSSAWEFDWQNPEGDIAERSARYFLVPIEYPYGRDRWRRVLVGYVPKLSQWVVSPHVEDWKE